jgi:general secretion pathway protein H
MRQKSSVHESQDAGLTLVEMIVTLAILALASAIAFPPVQDGRQWQSMHAVAVDIASALRAERSDALTSNLERSLVIDLSRRRFWGDGAPQPRHLPRDMAVMFRAVSGQPLSEGEAVVRFRPDGGSSGGTVVLTGRQQSARIIVDWLSGTTVVKWGP